MSVYLSEQDLKKINRAQNALLSVPTFDPPRDGTLGGSIRQPATQASSSADVTREWAAIVAERLRVLFETDHVYYTEPVRQRNESDPSDVDVVAPAHALLVCHPTADDAFEAGLADAFLGLDDGFSQFRDQRSTMLRRMVRSAGVGAFHDAPLYSTERQQASPLYQQIFQPRGIDRKLALSVPLQEGEAMLVIGFEAKQAPAFEGRRHRMLELLLPAFESGLRFRRHWARRPIGLQAAEEVPIPILFFDADARERFRNAAFRRLTQEAGGIMANKTSPASGAVARLRDVARHLAQEMTAARSGPEVLPVTRAVPPFRLRACPGVVYEGQPGVLVFVERGDADAPLPSTSETSTSGSLLPMPKQIRAQTDLTERESEVAELVAQGKTDQDIANQLGISVYTARRHTASILKKLALTSRAGVALELLRACR